MEKPLKDDPSASGRNVGETPVETSAAAPQPAVLFLLPLGDVEGLPVPVFEELNAERSSAAVGSLD